MSDFGFIHRVADAAGRAAAEAATPVPMIVQQHANMLNDRSAVVREWRIPEGVCGFAWVWFKGNTPWGRWAKKTGLASKGYPAGLQVWIGDYGQSMTRKEAYARAYAKVLRDYGIDAYAQSRMD
jgi:hypothetical protein